MTEELPSRASQPRFDFEPNDSNDCVSGTLMCDLANHVRATYGQSTWEAVLKQCISDGVFVSDEYYDASEYKNLYQAVLDQIQTSRNTRT